MAAPRYATKISKKIFYRFPAILVQGTQVVSEIISHEKRYLCRSTRLILLVPQPNFRQEDREGSTALPFYEHNLSIMCVSFSLFVTAELVSLARSHRHQHCCLSGCRRVETSVHCETQHTHTPAAHTIPSTLLSLTMVDIVVHLVPGDGEVVRVVMGVEPILVVVVHLVVGPHAPLMPVRVHPVVHVVNI